MITTFDSDGQLIYAGDGWDDSVNYVALTMDAKVNATKGGENCETDG